MIVDESIATLITAAIAAVVAIISLIVSIRTERERTKLESGLGIAQEIEQEKRRLLYAQLSEFYDPILALLSVNKSIFERIGPDSDARWDRSHPQEETATVWKELIAEVIDPNNLRICEIVEKKLHLIAPDDSIEPYLEFSTHAHAYRVFKEQPYEAYRLFRFPRGFLQHVEVQRNNLRQQMEKLLSTNPR